MSLYYFGRTLFKNSVAGLIAALSYGILPSVMAFFYAEVANDRFSSHFIDPRRFTILVRWGEGPHIVSLMFLPLAALFWMLFVIRIMGSFFANAKKLFCRYFFDPCFSF